MSEMKADMLDGPVGRTFLRYSVPWALSMVATGSAAVVDGIFVGRFAGAMSLAAVNLAVPAWSLVSGMGFMLVTGGSVRSGRYMGEGRPEEASAMCIKTFMALAAVMLLVCGVMYLRLDDVLDILGAGGDANELRALCREYLSTVLLFCPVFPLSYGMSYFIRVDGRPLLASAGLGAAALCNIMLDALLVGYAGMGVRGAALATGLAYLLSCLVLIRHFFSVRSHYVLPRRLGRWKEVFFAAWNGASEFVNEMSAGIIVLLFNLILMERMGGYGVAAFTVVADARSAGNESVLRCGGFSRSADQREQGSAEFQPDGFLSARGPAYLARARDDAVLGTDIFPGRPCGAFSAGRCRSGGHCPRLCTGLALGIPGRRIEHGAGFLFHRTAWAASSMLVAVSRSFALPLLMLVVLPRLFGDWGIFYATSASEALTLCLAAGLLLCGRRRCERRGRAC